MANRWCDGLGRYGGTKSYMLNGSSSQAWAQVDAAMILTSANPAIGPWALRVDKANGAFHSARRVFGAALTEVFIGLAIYCFALPSTEPIVGGSVAGGVFVAKVADAANRTQISVYLGTDGSLVLYRLGDLNPGTGGFNGVLLGRTAPCIGAGGRQHIEIYAKCDGATGAVEIRVDEVTRLNRNGLNTNPTGAGEFSQRSFGREILAGVPDYIDFTDFYVNDTTADGSGCDTFIGDCKSACFMVNADTAQADFALSTGVVGFSLLSEAPPNDATFISAAATTAESDFGLANPPANTTEILTVRPFIRGAKDDAGTCTVAPNMKSAGVKGTVTGQPVATVQAYYDSNVPKDPAAAAPWTLTTLSAALHVVERTA